ncbi:MAG: ABC transporter permease [Deltaproteobacteria bacterium]|nr:ABC transporter permease [Deltaproteobacteria bacterium]
MKFKSQFYPLFLGSLSLSAALLLWIIVNQMAGPRFLPNPLKVFEEIVRLFKTPLSGRTLIEHVIFSLRRVMAAYGLAIVTGLPLGLMMGWNATCRKIVMPIFEIFRPIPPIAWIPIAILWLGVAEGSKIYICYVGAFIILVLNSFTGTRYVDPLLIQAAKVFGASKKRLFLAVAVPAALPSIFAGLQNGMSMAWMCVLAAELVGGREGVGFIIIQGMNLDRPEMILAGMVVIGVLGTVLAAFLRLLEKLICPWRRQLV